MSPDENFGVAFAITLGASIAVVICLWRFLAPVLGDYCGDAKRGRLWTFFSSAIILFLPLFVLSLNLPPEHSWRSWIFPLVATVRWSVLSMLLGMVIIAVVASALHVPRELPMSRNELDDLRRLLDKVQELRARELLARLDATKPVNTKELDELNRLVDKIQVVRTRDLHGGGDGPSAN
jgi:hypothetical protein